jgi:Protein of unknown function (DUF3800)
LVADYVSFRRGLAVIFADAYFDESETKDPHVFCVAGYIFRRDRAEALEVCWHDVLGDYGLSHFHMVDCAHGNGAFRALTREQRVEVQTRLFDLLKAHMQRGICVTFDMRLAPMLEQTVLHGVSKIDPYTLCAYVALDRAAAWARKLGEDVEVRYFFEAGSANQRRANELMRGLFRSTLVSDRFHYAGHAFISKRSAAGVQCADILAWQATKDRKSVVEGRARRKDFNSLLERDHYAVHLDVRSATPLLRSLKRFERQHEEMRRSAYWLLARLLPGGELELIYRKNSLV